MCMLMTMAQQAVGTSKDVCSSIVQEGALLHDGILDLGPIVSSKSIVVASSSKLAKHVQWLSWQLGTSRWTRHLVSPLCPKCQAADDTPHHRCWTCNLLRSSTWSEVVDTRRLLPLASRSHLAGAGVWHRGLPSKACTPSQNETPSRGSGSGAIGKHISSVRHLCY